VRPAGVLLAIALAFALETTLPRFIRTLPAVDLLLIVVVYVGLTEGPLAGLLTGAVAGLVQDFGLSNGVIGIGGLAKTVVGFFSGVVGTQFIVAQPLPRFVVFFAATAVHQAITIGLGVLLDLRSFGTPYAAVAGEALVNSTLGIVAFQLSELLPGAVERRRTAGSGRTKR
jgi:rod shape-determining protein MreD